MIIRKIYFPLFTLWCHTLFRKNKIFIFDIMKHAINSYNSNCIQRKIIQFTYVIQYHDVENNIVS